MYTLFLFIQYKGRSYVAEKCLRNYIHRFLDVNLGILFYTDFISVLLVFKKKLKIHYEILNINEISNIIKVLNIIKLLFIFFL